MKIEFKINGEKRTMDVSADERLLDVIREDLGLTGTKEGCGEGECGACTVFFNGRTAPSCLIYAYEADGSEIWTIEGAHSLPQLKIIEEAFVDAGAVQCGYCIPGMVMSAKALLDSNPDPTRQDIRKALEGNFCRCTGYVKIVDAVELAAKKLKER